MKLSIIVPVYDAEERLEKCIESLLSQSFSDLELILVNDGSTDGSGRICDSYAKKDPRVVVIHQENAGAYNARLAGIKKAKGEFLGFCDSDDYVDSNMYEVLLKKQAETNSDIVSCSLKYEAFNYEQIEGCTKPSGVYEGDALEILKQEMFCKAPEYRVGMASNLVIYIFRAKLLKSMDYIKDIKLSLAEDTLCSFKAILKSNKITICNEFVPYHYICSESSQMHGYSPQAFTQAEYVYKNFKEFLIDNKMQGLIPSLEYFIYRLYCMIMIWVNPKGCIFSYSKEYANGIENVKVLRERFKSCPNIKGKDRVVFGLISRKMFFSYFAIRRTREFVRGIFH